MCKSAPMVSLPLRDEQPSDRKQIWNVNIAAFESDGEAKLVDSLRESGIDSISMVYEEKGEIVGHILFSPVELAGDDSNLKIMGLAPMAVVPEFQKRGFGSELVRTGIARCLAKKYDAVVVLGYPEYYPRFGFIPSVKYKIKSEYDVPDNVFMVLELKKGSLKGKSGVIKFHEAFGNL